MDILIMQVFVSLGLVLGSILLFLFTAKQRDFDHADRLALLPITDDDSASSASKSTLNPNSTSNTSKESLS